jgi:hypothetical protein
VTETMDGVRSPVIDPDFRPDCTVRYDEWAGCGVKVLRRAKAERVYVELVFLTKRGDAESHYLTMAQVEQLRAAVDAVTRTDPSEDTLRQQAGEEDVWVSAEAPAIVAEELRASTGSDDASEATDE